MTPPGGRPARIAARLAGVLVAAACVAGLYARLRGLGDRPLAVDEYYFLAGVEAILRQGVPALPGGGYYTRGLLAQYATALSVAVLGDTGFAARLPAAIFGLASAALLYLLARPRLGRPLAAVLAAILLVSSWEIEFSRFARMYALFQLTTLVFLWLLDRALLGPHWRWRYAAHGAAVLAVLSHQLGVLLVPFLFAPLVAKPSRFAARSGALRYALASALTALACAAYVTAKFRNLGVVDRLPAGFAAPPAERLQLPAFPFWSIGGDPGASLAVLMAALGLAAAGAALASRKGRRLDPVPAVEAVMFVSAALHAFTVTVGCALLLLARYGVHRDRERRARHLAVLAASGGVAFAWLAFAFASPGWPAASGGESLAGALRRVFFAWPDFYTRLVVPWQRELPDVGAAIGLAMLHQLWTRRRMPLAALVTEPAFVTLAVCVAFGVLRSPYASTRYAYFVYPVALYAAVLSVRDLSRRLPAAELVAVAACAGLFALSSDFDPRHIAGVATPEVGFRTGRFQRFAATWYPRLDYVTPAALVDRELARDPGARAVVFGQPPVSHYLRSAHAVYYGHDDPRLPIVSRERGTRELWSGQPLLDTPSELRAFARGAERILLVRSVGSGAELPIEEALGVSEAALQRLLVGRDGRLEVMAARLPSSLSPKESAPE